MTKVRMICRQIWLLLLLLLAVACTPGTAQPTAVSGEPSISMLDQLRGSDWNLMAWDGMTILTDAVPTLSFEEDGFGGTTGCNHYFAKAAFDGTNMSVDEIEMTEMFCEGVMEQERAYTQALQMAESLALEGEALTIHTPEGDMTFQPPLPATLTDTTWILDGMAQNGTVVSTWVDSDITAEFKDGQMAGSSGCNSYSASYEADGASLSLGQAVGTLMACEDEERNQRESEFLAALSTVAQYEIRRNTLTLSDVDGHLVLTFRAQES